MSVFKIIFFIAAAVFTTLNSTAQQQEDSRKLINLGPNINSASLEINPRISGDGKIIYFVREVEEQGIKFQDIWVAEKDSSNIWQPAKRLEKPFNTEPSNSVVYVSKDGTKLMIKGFYLNGKIKKRGFSFVQFEKGSWGAPQGIVIDQYSKLDKGLFNNVCTSFDNKVLIFSFGSSRKVLDNDIYISFRKEDATYTKPVKIGDNINVKGHMEFAAFLSEDNKTLYFTSTKPGGFGETDIYRTERMDDTWLKWSDPVNMGDKVNGAGRDGYYTLDSEGRYAYMVSDSSSVGLADIVMIELEQKPKPKPTPVVSIMGTVYDAISKKPVEAMIEYFHIPADTVKRNAHSDSTTGKYNVTLPYRDRYVIMAHHHGYMSSFDTIVLKRPGESIVKDFIMNPIVKGEKVVLKHVNFETNSAVLQAESYTELDKVLSFLTENPEVKILIGGHTDNVGKPEDNIQLSDNRAKSVMQYLLAKGIDADRLEAKGYGQEDPIATNDSEDGRSLNRRVEFTITQE